MKRFFITLCLSLFLFSSLQAKITSVSDYKGSLQQTRRDAPAEIKVIDYKDFVSLVKESAKGAKIATEEDLAGRTTAYAPGIYHKQQQEENQKSIFQKIYDNAMQRVSDDKNVQRADVVTPQVFNSANVKSQQKKWNPVGFPTVTVKIPPYNIPTPVPALEHIPYLMNAIEVMNNGMIKMEETVVVVANGEKLKHGLTKILPAKVYNGKGGKKRLDYSIVGVWRNDMPEEYHMVEINDYVLLVPNDNSPLVPGVYTYKFEYLIDNLLIDKGNAYMLYWDAGGYGWNLVVDRLGVTLLLPEKDGLLGHNVLFGSENNLYTEKVSVISNGPAGTAYITSRPLFIGEGMYLLAMIDKAIIAPVGLWQKFMYMFYDYGDVLIAFVGFLFIALSLLISWLYIKKQKKIQKLTLVKTAITARYLMFDKFDVNSACGFLLELYRKNIIDIQQSDDTILLIKRTDNIKNLADFEQKAFNKLFPSHDTIFNVNKNTKLMFSRFVKELRKGLKKQMAHFNFKLKFSYAAICFGMLILTEAFIAYFKISTGYTFSVLAIASSISGLFLLLWNIPQVKWLKYLLRFLIVDICTVAWLAMSMVMNPIASVLLLSAQIAIVVALYFYGKRNGLLRYYIQDIELYRDNIIKNADNITLGKNFLNYQSLIWVLDLADNVEPIKQEEYYKIPIMKEIIKVLS